MDEVSKEIPNPHEETAGWFTDEQWEAFRDEDFRAGKFVVVLMGTIFGIGVVLYSIVLWSTY